MLEVVTNQFKRCDLVKASGRVDSHTAPQLADTFEAINEAGRFKIVFDMSGVEYISSAGLRVMINVQKTCKRWNRGELVLAGVPEHIHGTLDLTGFVPLFKIFDDDAEAVGSF
ncbi:MAG: STAS domain-containing protein [Anaerolineales bacterium]|jgi:anti-sigma B factor antagonist|nr:MAG: STAS domain-containing protein [Anaerolineales bacterium]